MSPLTIIAIASPFWIGLALGAALMMVLVGVIVFLASKLVTTEGDHAIVRTGVGGLEISFDRAVVIPPLHSCELVPISVRKLRYDRTGDGALTFKCGTRGEVTADLLVWVNRTHNDVERAISFFGVDRLNDVELLREYFESMFNDSLDSIAGQFEYQAFSADKESFRENLLKHIGIELNGMVIDDICIHHLQKI